MKGANIVLIDLNPSTNVGFTLRDIIESCSKLNTRVQYELLENSKSVPCGRELSGIVSRRQPDLILLVLTPCHLQQAGALFQSMKSEISEKKPSGILAADPKTSDRCASLQTWIIACLTMTNLSCRYFKAFTGSTCCETFDSEADSVSAFTFVFLIPYMKLR